MTQCPENRSFLKKGRLTSHLDIFWVHLGSWVSSTWGLNDMNVIVRIIENFRFLVGEGRQESKRRETVKVFEVMCTILHRAERKFELILNC